MQTPSVNDMQPPSVNDMQPPSVNNMQPPSVNNMQPPSVNNMQPPSQKYLDDLKLSILRAEYSKMKLSNNTKSSTPEPEYPPSANVINCANTKNPSDCIWYSPSSSDRSNPMINMVCPKNKPDLCWMDTRANDRRQFKCGACNIKTNSQTETCHISMKASANKNTTGWESNMTTTFKNSCKNKWYNT